MIRIEKRKQIRLGASSVEFALIFPVILTFFLATMALSQAVLLRDTAQQAAYEGARKGLVLDITNQEVESATSDFLKKFRVRNPEISISPSRILNTTKEVSVSVRVPFRDNAWVAGPMIPSSWTMGAEVTLSLNRQPDDD